MTTLPRRPAQVNLYFVVICFQSVVLKYCSAIMRCDEVIDGVDGSSGPPSELRCTFEEISMEDSPAEDITEGSGTGGAGKSSKPKGNISWVSAEEAVRAEVRLYSHLFTVDSPDDKWEEQVRTENLQKIR